MEHKRSGRMTDIPQLDIPDILVDDEDEGAADTQRPGPGPATATAAAPSRATSAALLVADRTQLHPHHRSWSGASVDISLHETSYVHPLSTPRASGAVPPTGPGGPQRYDTSAFSFGLQETGEHHQPGSNGSSRRGSSVASAQLLDDSVWLDSIRRSATERRQSGWGH